MAVNRTNHSNASETPWYRGANVPMRVIRRFASQVADRFRPERVILFGSYAYGSPHADSDVDILVIMPCRNQIDQAVKIHTSLLPPFPMDIIVRTPDNIAWRLAEGDSFLREITSKGKTLYEADDARLGPKGGRRFHTRHPNSRKPGVSS